MTQRTIDHVVTPPVGLDTPLLRTHDLTRQNLGSRLDPFLIVSHFDMKGPVFPPHPHAGFAVATYILPESETGFVNQDSTGFSNEIAPGELHVTLAGSGLLHEETNAVAGQSALGFQIWIDVPSANRHDAPMAAHRTIGDIPVVETDHGIVRVVAGASQGVGAPIDIPTGFGLIDVTLKAGGEFRQDLTGTETAFLHVITGGVAIGDTTAKAGDVMFTALGGTQVHAQAGPEGARFLMLSGEPLHQAPVFGGPFVASDADELTDFKRAFAQGQMGHLTAFSEQPVGRG